MKHFVGIDVSHSYLDISFRHGDYFRLPNTEQGFVSLTKKLSSNSVVCMEATGVYFRPLAVYLKQRDFTVYVANPKQVKDFAKSRLTKNKTDKADSKLIAEFAYRFEEDLSLWDSVSDAHYALSLTVRFGEGLTKHKTALSNRLHALSFVYPSVVSDLQMTTDTLKAERQKVFDLATEMAKADHVLNSWLTALKKLPGFGDISSLRFLAYSKDPRWYPTASHFASHTGLVPKIKQSGNAPALSRISRMGSSDLRSILFFCALSASQTKTPEGDYYRQLVERGKPKKSAMTALAHKLSREAWAVCVHGEKSHS